MANKIEPLTGGEDNVESPPIFKTWPRFYAFVLLFEAGIIALLLLLTKFFE